VQFDHLSFNLADEHALEELQARIKAAGSEVTDVVDHGFIRSIYFTDPNGIALEASWWVTDATGREADYADSTLFSDPDPVPAVRELREHQRLDWLPTTQLS
jgi:catechol-2,3-dioxygenase